MAASKLRLRHRDMIFTDRKRTRDHASDEEYIRRCGKFAPGGRDQRVLAGPAGPSNTISRPGTVSPESGISLASGITPPVGLAADLAIRPEFRCRGAPAPDSPACLLPVLPRSSSPTVLRRRLTWVTSRMAVARSSSSISSASTNGAWIRLGTAHNPTTAHPGLRRGQGRTPRCCTECEPAPAPRLGAPISTLDAPPCATPAPPRLLVGNSVSLTRT